MEKYKADVLSIPTGYSEDIRNFAVSVLEVAMLRGETSKTFDDDYFYEQLEQYLTKESLNIEARFADRFLGETLWANLPDYNATTYLDFVDEFELGVRRFISEFLDTNRTTINIFMSLPIWKIELKQISNQKWLVHHYQNK